MAELHKKQLSGKLRSMKFMQRQQEQELQHKIEQEKKRAISESQWVVEYEDTVEKPKFHVEYESSFLPFTETTTIGRTSFQDFNKDIQLLASATSINQRLVREEFKEKQNSVSDDEYANRLSDLISVSNGPAPRVPTKAPPVKKRRNITEESLPSDVDDRSKFKKPA